MTRILVCITLLSAVCSGELAAIAATSNYTTRVNPKDASEMIIIPAGKFIMGSNDGEADEKPVHTVYLNTYQIGKYEVTVAQYRKFCKATGREMPEAPKWDWKNDHPMVNVTWFDAAAYCKWAGGRLPTEAEWEKAARGTKGWVYPWGNTWDMNKCANYEMNLKSTVSIGRYPAGKSPYGCMDMAGNVAEWCADWWASDYYRTSPSRNPKGPSSGSYRIVGGGGWYSYYLFYRCASRYYLNPNGYLDYLGFRLVR